VQYVKLARYVKLPVHRHDHDKGQSGTIQCSYLQLVVSIVFYDAKTVLGLICLQLNTIGWSEHETSRLCKEIIGWGTSVLLGLSVKAYGQGFLGQVLDLGVRI